jgi:hypothetical protein
VYAKLAPAKSPAMNRMLASIEPAGTITLP